MVRYLVVMLMLLALLSCSKENTADIVKAKEVAGATTYNLDDWSHENDVVINTAKAEQNDTKSMIALYRAYKVGKGVDKDITRAISYLRKASSLGDNEATRILMNITSKGIYETGRKKKEIIAPDKALKDSYLELYISQLMTNAKNDAEAAFWLGRYYEKGGLGTDVDVTKSQQYYEKSSQILEEKFAKGDVAARRLYFTLKSINRHPNVLKNEAVAAEVLNDLVAEGDRESLLLAARMYEGRIADDVLEHIKNTSDLTDESALEKAKELYLIAAKKGDAEALRRLVRHFEDFEPENTKAILNWVDKAIEANKHSEVWMYFLYKTKFEALTKTNDGKALSQAILDYLSSTDFEFRKYVYDLGATITDTVRAIAPYEGDTSPSRKVVNWMLEPLDQIKTVENREYIDKVKELIEFYFYFLKEAESTPRQKVLSAYFNTLSESEKSAYTTQLNNMLVPITKFLKDDEGYSICQSEETDPLSDGAATNIFLSTAIISSLKSKDIPPLTKEIFDELLGCIIKN